MKDLWVGSIRLLLVVALAVGCEKASGDNEVDAGADGGRPACPDYEPDDAGVIRLMRGCPLTIDYAIR